MKSPSIGLESFAPNTSGPFPMLLSVKLEISKGAANRGISVDTVGNLLSAQIASHLAPAIQNRVQNRGDLAGQRFPGWSTRRTWPATSPRYPDRAHGRKGPSGAERYPSRAEYHRENATLPGSYSTTGGMWSGLSVVIGGARVSTIQFRGRSEGADPNFFRYALKKGQQRRQIKARGAKVSNALKAWTVLQQHGVNVLALSELELQRIAEASTLGMALGVGHALPVTWNGKLPPTLDGVMREVWG